MSEIDTVGLQQNRSSRIPGAPGDHPPQLPRFAVSTLFLPPAGAECFAAELPPRHRQALAVPVQTDQGRVRTGPKVTIVAL